MTNVPTTDEQLPELPDSVRVPLDELWADAEYLITRVVDKTLDQAAFVALIKQRINDGKNAAREAIAAVVAELRDEKLVSQEWFDRAYAAEAERDALQAELITLRSSVQNVNDSNG